MKKISPDDIVIRNNLTPGDLGYVVHLHGSLYAKEYNYGIEFEAYVAEGLVEFYRKYDPERSRVWICEHSGNMVGFLLLLDRGELAQLRYFIIHPGYRGVGLGKLLMSLFMDYYRSRKYKGCYLWTTHELYAASSLYTRWGFKLVEEKTSDAFGKTLFEQKYELTAV